MTCMPRRSTAPIPILTICLKLSRKVLRPYRRRATVGNLLSPSLAGVMANSGVKGAEGTALRNVMLRLSKPTGEASKYLRRLGVQTMDGNGNFRDAIDILADLEKGLVAGYATESRRTVNHIRSTCGNVC